LDEWDFIFHLITEKEKMAYLSFLRSLLKDRPYVLLVYMTGILPIAKYSSGSELNMFTEFTMAKSPAFSAGRKGWHWICRFYLLSRNGQKC